jgi:hypothetical protein
MNCRLRAFSLRTALIATALLAAVQVAPPAIAGGAAAPPRVLEARAEITGNAAPVWVSADAATTPDGGVDWDLLGEQAKSIFHSVERQPLLPVELVPQMPDASGVFYETKPDGTTVPWLRYGPATHEEPGGKLKTLQDVERQASGIYLGRVVGIEEGFLEGDVGSLLRLRTDQVLLPSGALHGTGELYLFWPEARFSIGELNFWKSNPAYPPRPPLGSRVLVVADQRVPLDIGRKLVLPRPDALFVEPPDGGLEISEKAAVKPGRDLASLDDVIAEIERLVAADPERNR